MQSVQRHFGKYMKRTADDKQVSVLLKDFQEADELLTRIIDASKAWRESWISILTYQHRLCAEFQTLYAPIIGATEDYHGHQAVETPENTLSRTARIATEYEDLKRDLTEEIGQVETRMIRPASDAKDSLSLLKKTIKKREDRKLDYERYQSRVDTGAKKTKRSERDTIALAKSQTDLEKATELYEAADANLRSCLPRLLTATFSLLPHLLSAQIHIQNALLAHYYTMLHSYCSEEGFPSPAPPMDEVIRQWDDAFKPVQHEAETIAILASGKTVRTSMTNGHHITTTTATTNNSNYRRPSNNSFNRVPSVSPARALSPSPNYDQKRKMSSSPSQSSTSLLSPPPSEPIPSSVYQTPSGISFSPAAPHTDYFSRDRQPSTSQGVMSPAGLLSSPLHPTSTLNSQIANKKKPPPPPPRKPSETAHFVTALYDFSGQSEGDLVFREGDRIKVVKKTESTDDWWIGELKGVRGSFPANYVQ